MRKRPMCLACLGFMLVLVLLPLFLLDLWLWGTGVRKLFRGE